MSQIAQKEYRPISKDQALVLELDEVGLANISLAGGKNASLGEMIQQLLNNRTHSKEEDSDVSQNSGRNGQV